MALTYRQRVNLAEDLLRDAANALAKLAELSAYMEQLMARLENARWGDDPLEPKRAKWVKAADKATYQPKGKRK